MKYAKGITCLCTVLACSGAVMAQGMGFGFRGAPEIQQEKPSHALLIEVIDINGTIVDDAIVTAMTHTGGFRTAVQLQDGTYYIDKGIGSKTIVNVNSLSFGAHSVDFQVPANPQLAAVQIFLSGTEQAKMVSVDRRQIQGRAIVPVGDSLSHVGGPAGGIAGASNCCIPNGGVGCDDPDCEAAVCAVDPFCCDVAWDGICADEALTICGKLCGGGGGPVCAGDETPENEPVCADNYVDATNGGCNSTPPVFSPIACGQEYCSEAGTFISGLGNTRDTDWYRITLGVATEVTWSGTGSFPFLIGVVNNFGVDSCAGVNAFLVFATGTPGQPISVTTCLPAGTWYLFAAPSGFTGVPCGSEYTVALSCVPNCAPPPGPCDDPNAGDCCQAGGNGGVGCNDPECCNTVCAIDPFCCDVEWDGICADEANDLCESCQGGGSNCCVAHGTPGCDDPDCEAAVCAVDPFCCDVQWDGICADEAADICAKLCGGGGGQCPPNNNDCCVPNGTPGCNQPACCESVCALDPFCCDVAWDSICAGEALADPNCDCGGGNIPNDNCVDRIDIENGSTDFNNIGANTDGPAPCGGMGSDIWFNYNSDFTGDLTIDTFGSGYDTVIALYNGCNCPVGAPLACNDDCPGSGNLQSCITVPVVAGQCYKLQVGGFVGSQGTGVINITKEFATGACCLAGGECVQVTGVECENLGGNYQGDGTSCAGGYTGFSDCNNAYSSIVGLPGTIMAPVASSTDDGGDNGIPIGFTFNFFGVDHGTIGIASNGYLAFDGNLADFTNDSIPNTLTPNDMIAPYWDDWAPNEGGDVFYRTTGAPGSRTFTVQWHGVDAFGGPGGQLANFQAILHETSNCIEFRYGTPLFLASPTIGIESPGGTSGFSVPGAVAGDCLQICPSEGPCPTKVPVNVDIKPGVCPNPFHLTNNQAATLAVAIVGKDEYNVNDIDLSTVTISRADGVGGSVSPLSAGGADVSTAGGSGNCSCGANGGDGTADLLLQFQRTAMQAALEIGADDVGDSIELTVSGFLNDGTEFNGSDCVVVE